MAMWDSLRELERLRRDIDRIHYPLPSSRPWTLGFVPGTGGSEYPRMNVAETEAGYVAEALAPGVDPKSFDVSVKENMLTISGEKKGPEGAKPETFHRSERAAGKFVRTIELPAEIDAAEVKALYRDGVLTVSLPKAEAAKAKRIQIQVG